MQGKGLIKLFLVLIIAVSLLQFAYFIPTNRIENNAHKYALQIAGPNVSESSKEFKAARAKFLDSVSSQEVFSIPLIKSYTYSELKKQQLALGLDLKGGMSAVLQVDLKDFLKSLAGRNSDNADFQKAIEDASAALKTSQSDFITLFTNEYRKIAGPDKLARIFARSETLGEINATTSDAVVTRLIRQKANETVKLTFERLKKRIDELGVAQPNVSLDASRDIIVVEMPGIDNPARARQFLSASAKLEFWETFRYSDPGVLEAFRAADAASNTSIDTNALTQPVVTMRDSVIYDNLGKAIDTVQVASTITTNTTNTGALLRNLSLNGGTMSPSVIGIADKSKLATINEILQRKEIKALFPKNAQLMWSYKPSQDADGVTTNNYELYMIKKQANTDNAPLDGDVVTNAIQTLNPVNGQVEVNLRMNATGAKKWAEMTTKAANDGNREIAIALDGEVVSAPRVNDAITQGSSSITGNFTVEEAVDFASILEVGKLPAKTEIVQESNVGPSLGKANISKSINALFVGFVMVIVTMLSYYAGAGIISIIALLLNIFLILGTLSSFGTVLTLSGIAGIVLTIGMAVDANVIIYERVKEELAAGKSLKESIKDGYYHSYSAIIDANVTTILTAMVLAYFGLGSVKGFAIVLIIGVLSSIFTAVLVSRLLIDWWVGKGNDLSFWTNFSKGAFKNINIDWIGKRKYAYLFSGTFIIIGLISVFTKGFDLGVDYRGGYSYNIQFTKESAMTAEKLRDGMTKVLGGSPIVKQVDAENTFQLTTAYLIDQVGEDISSKVIAKVYDGIKEVSGTTVSLEEFSNPETGDDKIHVTSSAQVGPTMADDLKRTSIYAGLIALFSVFLYILLRFSKWQYSVGAIVSLAHDALIVIGVFSLFWGIVPFSLEVDQVFIAAILTVLGYSINDTVIFFDRIRENFGLYSNKSKDEIINSSINSTLSRTLMTSFTTIVVVLALFLFGGSSIKGFAFALLVGIGIGTYSSIFMAAPILHDLGSELRVTRREPLKSGVKSEKKSFSRASKG